MLTDCTDSRSLSPPHVVRNGAPRSTELSTEPGQQDQPTPPHLINLETPILPCNHWLLWTGGSKSLFEMAHGIMCQASLSLVHPWVRNEIDNCCGDGFEWRILAFNWSELRFTTIHYKVSIAHNLREKKISRPFDASWILCRGQYDINELVARKTSESVMQRLWRHWLDVAALLVVPGGRNTFLPPSLIRLVEFWLLP
jgi:hypothetical protein